MKQYLTEFDELQAALKKVRIDENVMPYHMGRLVEDEDSYNKIQKLLDCPQMAGSHRYLYDLDVENLQEGEIDKINQLFDLGVKKGYIDNSFEEEFQKEENPDAIIADEPESCPECKAAADVKQQFSAPIPCWTILYSATKNGEIKSGECYSNAVSVSAAKADCLAKLAKFGYENVSVLAIEAGDPDMCGATDVSECGVKEDDMLKNRSHNLHKVDEGVGRFDADKGMTYNDYEVECTYEISPRGEGGMVYSDSFSGIVEGASVKSMIGKAMAAIADEEGVSLADVKILEFNSVYFKDREITDDANRVLATLTESGKNPYIAGMKVVTGGKVSTAKPAAKKSSKKLKEDDEEDSGDTEGEDTEGEDTEGEDTEGEDTEGEDTEGEDTEGEDTEGDDEGEDTDGGEELDDSKKAQYKNEYRRIFQEVMAACKFGGKSFNDLTIDEKVTFFTKLKERWTKADPKEFMSDKEQDQLESITIEGGNEGSDDTESEDTEDTNDTEGEDTEGEDTEGEDTEGEDTEGSEDEGSEDEGSDDTESSDDTEGEDTEGSEDEGSDDTEGEE